MNFPNLVNQNQVLSLRCPAELLVGGDGDAADVAGRPITPGMVVCVASTADLEERTDEARSSFAVVSVMSVLTSFA